jgi:hypothetical protein
MRGVVKMMARRRAPPPALWAEALMRSVGRTSAPTATATIAAGVAKMMTCSPQMGAMLLAQSSLLRCASPLRVAPSLLVGGFNGKE